MIQIARPKSSNGDTGGSAAGLERSAHVDLAHRGPFPLVRRLERLVAQRPGLWLGAAVSLGIALGWWVKRR